MRRHAFAEFLHRFIAAGGATLVLALTVFAASPQLHDWLHDGDVGSDVDGCAVVLFAGGVSQPLNAIEVPAPAIAWCDRTPIAATEIFYPRPVTCFCRNADRQ